MLKTALMQIERARNDDDILTKVMETFHVTKEYMLAEMQLSGT